jgi:hypothetical protein
MSDEQRITPGEIARAGLDPGAVHDLFLMQPDNGPLLPAQMVKRALFPRWEVIRPAAYNPVDVEDQMIENILNEAMNEQDHLGEH